MLLGDLSGNMKEVYIHIIGHIKVLYTKCNFCLGKKWDQRFVRRISGDAVCGDAAHVVESQSISRGCVQLFGIDGV